VLPPAEAAVLPPAEAAVLPPAEAEEVQDVPLNKFKPLSPVAVAVAVEAPAPAHDIEPEAALATKFGPAPATAPVELASAPELQIVLPSLLEAEPVEF
jgi:hypothetical protein